MESFACLLANYRPRPGPNCPRSFFINLTILWIIDLNKLFMDLLNHFLLYCGMLENNAESKPVWEEVMGLSWLILDDE